MRLKKLHISTLACAIAIGIIVTPVKADTPYEATGDGNHDVPVSLTVNSSFTIKLPAKVTLNEITDLNDISKPSVYDDFGPFRSSTTKYIDDVEFVNEITPKSLPTDKKYYEGDIDITVKGMLENGETVFVVPNDYEIAQSTGCNALCMWEEMPIYGIRGTVTLTNESSDEIELSLFSPCVGLRPVKKNTSGGNIQNIYQGMTVTIPNNKYYLPNSNLIYQTDTLAKLVMPDDSENSVHFIFEGLMTSEENTLTYKAMTFVDSAGTFEGNANFKYGITDITTFNTASPSL